MFFLSPKEMKTGAYSMASSSNNNNNVFVCTHLTLGNLCPCCSTTINEKKQEAYATSSNKNKKKRKLGNKATTTNNGGRKKKKGGSCINEEQSYSWGYSTELKMYDDPWKIRKVLEKSDLGSMTRLLLGKELAEKLVKPVLGVENVDGENGIQVRICDVDTDNSLHTLIFKKWTTSQSYVFIGNWKKDFVGRRGLKEGDEIGLHWDPYNHHFNFSLLHHAAANLISK